MPESNNSVTGYTGAAGAGLLTYGLLKNILDSQRANRFYSRYIHKPEIMTYALTSSGTDSGRGEGRMAANVSDMLSHNGFNSYFINMVNPGEATISAANLSPEDIRVLANLTPETMTDPEFHIGGIKQKDWLMLLRSADETGSRGLLLKRLASGKIDGFTPAELATTITIAGRDAVSGKFKTKPYSSVSVEDGNIMVSGRRPQGIFSGEAGMNYTGLRPYGVRTRDIAENDTILGAKNLARLFNFQANYTPDSELIPASVDTSVWNRNKMFSMFRDSLAKHKTNKYIHSINPDANTRGKQILFISTGSAGPLAPEKIQETLTALGGRNDVHLLAQVGKGTLSGTSKFNYDTSFLKTLPKDKVTLVETIPSDQIQTLYRGSNVNLGHSGSSTVNELMGTRRPVLFLSDFDLGNNNAKYMSDRFSVDKPVQLGPIGAQTRIRKYLDETPGANFTDVRNNVFKRSGGANLGYIPDPLIQQILNFDPRPTRKVYRNRLNDMLDNPIAESGAASARASDFIRRVADANQRTIAKAHAALDSSVTIPKRLRGRIGLIGGLAAGLGSLGYSALRRRNSK